MGAIIISAFMFNTYDVVKTGNRRYIIIATNSSNTTFKAIADTKEIRKKIAMGDQPEDFSKEKHYVLRTNKQSLKYVETLGMAC